MTPAKKQELQELENVSAADHFWNLPPQERTPTLKQIAHLTPLLQEWEEQLTLHEDLETVLELYQEEEMPSYSWSLKKPINILIKSYHI